MTFTLLATLLLAVAVLGSTDAGGSNPIHARNATGGPVKPATTRDYIWVTLFMVVAVVCALVGLWFMTR